jgi:hypothetical protein
MSLKDIIETAKTNRGKPICLRLRGGEMISCTITRVNLGAKVQSPTVTIRLVTGETVKVKARAIDAIEPFGEELFMAV